MQRHFYNANLWSDGLNDDPRYKSRTLRTRPGSERPGPGTADDCWAARPQPFTVRVTVIGVQTKHAWVLAPDHLLLTRHLIADLDNALDWLRPRIIALA